MVRLFNDLCSYNIYMLNFRDILYLLDWIFLLRKEWGGSSANWKKNDPARKKEGLAMRGEHSKKPWVKRERN